jgi:hypothetical protein
MWFYLKLTDQQAQSMISLGLSELFGSTTTAFDKYTKYILDNATSEKYWKAKNLRKKGVLYDVIGWIDENYPSLTRYDWAHVSQFIEQPL